MSAPPTPAAGTLSTRGATAYLTNAPMGTWGTAALGVPLEAVRTETRAALGWASLESRLELLVAIGALVLWISWRLRGIPRP